MAKRISIYEYKRRVFNKCLLECMTRVHGMILNGDGMNGLNPFASDMENAEVEQTNKLAAKMCEKYMCDEMHLAESTIQTTRKRLSESITFMHDVMDVSEAIADAKAEDVKKAGVEMDDDQEIELNQEDQAVIDHLFDEKTPEMQIDQIRDSLHCLLKHLIRFLKRIGHSRAPVHNLKKPVVGNHNQCVHGLL